MLPAAGRYGFNRKIRPTNREVAKEGVACPEGKKPKSSHVLSTTTSCGFWKKSVNDFKGGAVATYSNKIPEASCVRFTRKPDGVATGVRFAHFQLNASGAQL